MTADAGGRSAGLLDALYYGHLHGGARLRSIFSGDGLLQRWLDAEAALAHAQARVGLIPEEAARGIERCARADRFDQRELGDEIARRVHPLVPVVEALGRAAGADAGGYVHWGATTQDIMDTASVLQLRDAAPVVDGAAAAVESALAELARAHRDTPMAGRTHGQHAVPITFGLKVAVWLDEWRRNRDRFAQCLPRVLTGQLGGAAGTLATMPEHGPEVRRLMMERLGLGDPPVAWHTARDRIAEWCAALAFLAGTCGKIAREVIALQKDEVGELAEPHETGKTGSSTMPHKRNPMLSEAVMALCQLVTGGVGQAFTGLLHEHERDMGPWQAEWRYVPDLTGAAAGCLQLTARVLSGLTVNAGRMRENLHRSAGAICSEAVMIRLGRSIGRQRAHALVHEITMDAYESGRDAGDAMRADARIRRHLDADELERLLDPANHLGHAAAMVDGVLSAG